MQHVFHINLLRQLTNILGATQEELAQAAQIAPSTWSRLMHGETRITIKALMNLCNYLRMPVRHFIIEVPDGFNQLTTSILTQEDYILPPGNYRDVYYDHDEVARRIGRHDKQVRQYDVATVAGCDISNIGRRLKLTTRFTVENFLIICDALSIPWDAILVDRNIIPKTQISTTAKTEYHFHPKFHKQEPKTRQSDIAAVVSAAVTAATAPLLEELRSLREEVARLRSRSTPHPTPDRLAMTWQAQPSPTRHRQAICAFPIFLLISRREHTLIYIYIMGNGTIKPRAIWLKLTAYLVPWTTNEYGTGMQLSGKRVVELRPLARIKQLLREPVDEDRLVNMPCEHSLSQLRYDIIRSGLVIDPRGSKLNGVITLDGLNDFLPVSVPEYLLTANGVMRQFSRVMQFQPRTALHIAGEIYKDFWRHVYAFSVTFDGIDRDMLETFCEDNNISSIHVDDLRNQFQRLKRRNYFLNES